MLLGNACSSAYAQPYDSILRFLFLLVSCNLLQVFRDGLISLFIFTFVNMLPLMVLVSAHLLVTRFAKLGVVLRQPRGAAQ
jgi:hypothetical protein